MTRDWDIIRKILIAIEKHEGYKRQDIVFSDLKTEAKIDDCEMMRYYLRLLSEDDLIDASIGSCGKDGVAGILYGLTWSGHELLGMIADEKIWGAVKNDDSRITINKITAFANHHYNELAKQSKTIDKF